jgi:hypothetical protein
VPDAPEIRLLRESLETALSPDAVASLLFSALQERGGVPSGRAEMLALVRGPVRRGLLSQLGEPHTSDVLERVEAMMMRAVLPTRRRDDEITRDMIFSEDALRVVVASAREHLAQRLTAAFGDERLMALTAEDETTLVARLRAKPFLVLVDGAQFPHIEPAALVARLAPIAERTLGAVWGGDLPYGHAVLGAARDAGVGVTPFDRGEGLEPLIDLLRAVQT